ncbi:MAG: aldo/keto reductase [Planctomycetota bacterium]|jgi:aryl-alcohol dehydrogenase-like predicted oxidoreductase
MPTPQFFDASQCLPVGLGTAGLGITGNGEEGKLLLDRFLAKGGRLIDTARIYSDWVPGEKHRSERILGDWLAERGVRDDVVLCTKGGHYLFEDRTPRLAPEQLEEDLNGSLESLRVDSIDLYWLHRDDESRPVAPIMDTLHRFQQSGRIRHYAASNWSADRIREANAYAHQQGIDGFVASQVEWNLATLHRTPREDTSMLDFSPAFEQFHRETGMPAIPFSSQAQGYFSKRSISPEVVVDSPFDTPANRAIHKILEQALSSLRLTMGQAVLAYLWSQPFPVIPLLGCRTLEQLNDSMGAVGRTLPTSLMTQIEELLKTPGD